MILLLVVEAALASVEGYYIFAYISNIGQWFRIGHSKSDTH